MESTVVDSRQKMLSVEEILQIAAKNTGIKAPLPKIMEKITTELSIPGTWKFRHGNTLFLAHKDQDKPHWGLFRALNADTARNYLDSSKLFIKKAYDDGFDFLITQFEDETIMNIFKAIARNPVRPDMGYVTHRTKSGGYQVTIQCGTPRKEIK